MGLRGGNRYVYGITTVCAAAFCLFGYDNGLMGEVVTETNFLNIVGNPGSSLLGFVVSCYEVGCMVGALLAMFVGEHYGRRRMIFAGCGIHLVGTAINASSFSQGQVIASRVIIGVGMGMFTSTCPAWLAESVPAEMRGSMVAIQLTNLISGTNIAFWLNYGMSFVDSSISWRFPFAFQALFTLFALVLTCFLPESPRWLVSQNRTEEAVQILSKLRGVDPDNEIVQAEFADISSALGLEQESSSWKSLFTRGSGRNRVWTRIAIASSAQAMQSASGICFLEYYFPFVLTSIGLSNNVASLVSGCSQVWYLLSSFLTWYLINKLGRRRLFFLGSSGMGACMIAITICLWHDSPASNGVSVAFLFIYLSFFTWGWMSNMWAYPAEILPLRVRSKGLAISVFVNWSFQFWTVEIAPVSIDNIGWRTYIIWTVLNFACLAIAYFFFPETSGMTLESVDFMFSTDESIFQIVRKSDQMFRNHVHWDVGMAQEVGDFGVGEKQVVEYFEGDL